MPTYYSDYYAKRTAVYRLYDIAGDLLYVGLAIDPSSRFASHKRKSWGELIHRHTVEWFDCREDAKHAERTAIHDENPAHNIVRPRMECC